jgi:hypothetical protein
MDSKILVHEIGMIDPKLIKFDKSNPNSMSEEKYEALRKVMIKYGFGDTVKLDYETGCIDGQHKTMLAIELGIPKVPYTRFSNVKTAVDRKILRQIFNKLKGEHDPIKDAKDFKLISDKGQLEEFADLMGEEEKKFEKEIEMLELEDVIPGESSSEETVDGDKMKITIEYDKVEDYELVLTRLKAIDEDLPTALLNLVSPD